MWYELASCLLLHPFAGLAVQAIRWQLIQWGVFLMYLYRIRGGFFVWSRPFPAYYFLVFWVGCLLPFSALANVYYASPNGGTGSGTKQDPWSLAHAMKQAQAGDTVRVLAGRYLGKGKEHRLSAAFSPSHSGRASEPIRFEAYPKGVAVHLTLSSGWGPVLGANDKDYVYFKGFTITEGEGTPPRFPTLYGYGAVAFDLSSHSRIEDSEIIGRPRATVDNHSGIRLNDTHHLMIRNCKIHGVKSRSGDSYINNNGIESYRAFDTIVERCEFYDNTISIFDKSGGQRNTYRLNYFHDEPSAITIASENEEVGDLRNSGSAIYQNLFVDCGSYGGAIQLKQASDCKVYNNTFYRCVGSYHWHYGVIGAINSVPAQFEIWNNLMSGGAIPYHWNKIAHLKYSDYNLFHGTTPFVVNFDSVGNGTLAAWRSRYSFDSRSQDGNPRFINAGGSDPEDYKLKADSPCWTDGRGGKYAKTVGAYILGNEQIGYRSGKIHGEENHPPVAEDQSAGTTVDHPVSLLLLAQDQDGDPLQFAILRSPRHGILEGILPQITYSPNTGYVGTDTFTFSCNDGKIDSNVATISIRVDPAQNSPPVVELVRPRDGAAYRLGETVSVHADASDADGQIVKVEFFEGEKLVRTDKTPPFEYTWDDAPTGRYTFKAKAYDNKGAASRFSEPVHISIKTAGLDFDCNDAPSGVIWCDDFEDTSALSNRYFEYDDNKGNFVPVAGVGKDGSRGLRVKWKKGQINGGSLKRAFGRNPYLSQGHVHEDFDEIYWSMDVRTQEGWKGGGPDKFSRAACFATGQWAEGMIAHLWTGEAQTLSLDPATGIDKKGRLVATRYNDFPNLRWLGYKQGKTPLFASHHAGKWFNVEAHVRLNTPGQSNGLFEFWIDGELEARVTDIDWHSTWNLDPSTYKINVVFFENWWTSGAPADQEHYWDNLVISTTRIGQGPTSNEPPVAEDLTLALPDAQAKTFELSAYDANGDRLTFAVHDPPRHGTLSGTPPTLTYQPTPGYLGRDVFTFVANDGQLDSNLATVQLEISARNEPPKVSLLQPSNSAIFVEGSSIVLVAEASDQDGFVQNVRFIRDGVVLYEDHNPPYKYVWAKAKPGAYTLKVRAMDDGGLTRSSEAVSVTVDTVEPERPKAPTALSATAEASSQIKLDWEDNSENEKGFKIDRKEAGRGDWERVATTQADTTEFRDRGLFAGRAYNYRVMAYNKGGNSGYSNEATVTALPQKPAAPSLLQAKANSSTKIELHWKDNSQERGFQVQRLDQDAGWLEIGSVGRNVVRYEDGALLPKHIYLYRVRSFNQGVLSDWSNIARARTPEQAEPRAPKVEITSPEDGSAFDYPATIPVHVQTSDEDGSIVKVIVYVDGIPREEDLGSPFVYRWEDPQVGEHEITCMAIDDSGLFSLSDPVRVLVRGGESDGVSPSNGEVLSERRPRFRWLEVPGASWYRLWFEKDGLKVHSLWLEQEEPHWTPDFDLRGGAYRWWIQPWTKDHGEGAWSGPHAFTIETCEPLSVRLVSPSSKHSSTRLNFVWEAEPCSTWYRFWIEVDGQKWLNRWVKADPDAQQVEIPVEGLPFGMLEWWVQSWSEERKGPWSEPMRFTIGEAIPLRPSTTLFEGHVELAWYDRFSAEASWYQLWVSSRTGKRPIKPWVHRSEAQGEALIKSYVLEESLSPGDYEWWIRTWLKNSYGPWSEPLRFTVAGP